MTRKEFLKKSALLGLSIPFQSTLSSCTKDPIEDSDFEGSVLIIGAGAAGLAAGYLLAQRGIDFQILEASTRHGGRMKKATSFVDFPISLGAEWLHAGEGELASIVNAPSVDISTQLGGYRAQDQVGYFENGNLSYSTLSEEFGRDFIDKKFIASSWLDFFDEYIVPSISSKIGYGKPIASIDYQGPQVIATETDGTTHTADKVIVTVPLKILQEGDITFSPTLPRDHKTAILQAPVWGGIKCFFEFSENFYPTFLEFSDSETPEGQRLYYDAAYGQNSDSHVLGLVALGDQARPYLTLTGDARRDFILNELDDIFSGLASQHYMNHIVQNWDIEPFIKSAYLSDNAPSLISKNLSESVEDKIYFAGEAYSKTDDWGGVHNASQSARDAINEFA